MTPVYFLIDLSFSKEPSVTLTVKKTLGILLETLKSEKRTSKDIFLSCSLNSNDESMNTSLVSLNSFLLPNFEKGGNRGNLKNALILLDKVISSETHPDKDHTPVIFLFTREQLPFNAWKNLTKTLKNINRSQEYFFHVIEKPISNVPEQKYCNISKPNYLNFMINAILCNHDQKYRFNEPDENWTVDLEESNLSFGKFGKFWKNTASNKQSPLPYYFLPDLRKITVSQENQIQTPFLDGVQMVVFERKDGIIEVTKVNGSKSTHSISIWEPKDLPLDSLPLNSKGNDLSIPTFKTFESAIISLCDLMKMHLEKALPNLCLDTDYIWLSKKGIHLINLGAFEINDNNQITAPQIDDIKRIILKYLELWVEKNDVKDFFDENFYTNFWSKWDSQKGLEGVYEFIRNGNLHFDEKLIFWRVWFKRFIDQYNSNVSGMVDEKIKIKPLSDEESNCLEININGYTKILTEEPFNQLVFNEKFDSELPPSDLNLNKEIIRLRSTWVNSRKKLGEIVTILVSTSRKLDQTNRSLELKKTELISKNNKIEDIKSEIINISTKRSRLEKENKNLEENLNLSNSKIEFINNNLSTLKEKIKDLEIENKGLIRTNTSQDVNLKNANKNVVSLTEKNKKLQSNIADLIINLERLNVNPLKRFVSILIDIALFFIFFNGIHYLLTKSFPDFQAPGINVANIHHPWHKVFWICFLIFSLRSIFSPGCYLIGIYPIRVKENKPIELLDVPRRLVSGAIQYGILALLFMYASANYQVTTLNFNNFNDFLACLNKSSWIYFASSIYLIILSITTILQSLELKDSWFFGSTMFENFILNIGFCSINPEVIEDFQTKVSKLK